jgi:hypothetical protein
MLLIHVPGLEAPSNIKSHPPPGSLKYICNPVGDRDLAPAVMACCGLTKWEDDKPASSTYGIYVQCATVRSAAPPIPPRSPRLGLIAARMVNFNDPMVIVRDAGAYAFAIKHRSMKNSLNSFCDSCLLEVLARVVWSLHVSLPSAQALRSHHTSNNNNTPRPFPAGRSSPPLTTSGLSSEGNARTVGRYGSVMMRFFTRISSPGPEL